MSATLTSSHGNTVIMSSVLTLTIVVSEELIDPSWTNLGYDLSGHITWNTPTITAIVTSSGLAYRYVFTGSVNDNQLPRLLPFSTADPAGNVLEVTKTSNALPKLSEFAIGEDSCDSHNSNYSSDLFLPLVTISCGIYKSGDNTLNTTVTFTITSNDVSLAGLTSGDLTFVNCGGTPALSCGTSKCTLNCAMSGGLTSVAVNSGVLVDGLGRSNNAALFELNGGELSSSATVQWQECTCVNPAIQRCHCDFTFHRSDISIGSFELVDLVVSAVSTYYVSTITIFRPTPNGAVVEEINGQLGGDKCNFDWDGADHYANDYFIDATDPIKNSGSITVRVVMSRFLSSDGASGSTTPCLDSDVFERNKLISTKIYAKLEVHLDERKGVVDWLGNDKDNGKDNDKDIPAGVEQEQEPMASDKHIPSSYYPHTETSSSATNKVDCASALADYQTNYVNAGCQLPSRRKAVDFCIASPACLNALQLYVVFVAQNGCSSNPQAVQDYNTATQICQCE